MSQAPQYVRATDFSQDEVDNLGGRSTVRTAQLDAELDSLGTTANALRTNQSLNQRDDGEIRDGRVKLFTLSADVLALMTTGNVTTANIRGAWLTATAYVKLDIVTINSNTYICSVAHTSGTFATDLAAIRWLLFAQGATAAASIAFTPTGTIAATNVQAAIEETDTENRAASLAYDTALRADLASVATLTKGAGQVGFLYSLIYGASTVGKWLQDLATSTGAAFIGFIEAGAGAILRTLQARLRDSVSMKGFGAVGDGATNDTAAVNLALATGASLVIPQGDYLVDNLTWTASNRKLIALGRVRFIKRANGPILTMSGANNTLQGIEFWGDASTPVLTGDNLVITGDSNTLIDCGSRWAFGRAIKCTGNQLNLIGTCDVYQTGDATATGYDIELGGAALTLYHRITDIRSSQATGGILLTNTGAASIKGSQFGKLKADKGVASAGNHGPYVLGCRINGATDIQQSNTSIDCSSSSANVTIGDNLSGVSLGDSFLMASGTTVTVGSGLSSCELDVLAKLEDGGVTVTIGATTLTGPNNIGITEKTFAAAISAVGGAPALGNGTLTMYYSRRGRRYNVSYRFTFGSTTNMGTGTFYISLPVVPRNTIARIGSAQVLDAGVQFFVAAVQALADGTARMSFTTHGAASSVTNLVPMTWATSDDMQGSVEFDV